MIRFNCPACSQQFSVKNEMAGKRSKCPKCGKSLTVPDDEPEVETEIVRARPLPPAPQVQYVPVPFQVQSEDTSPRQFQHTHRAKGAFGTGFKGTLGCLLAVIAVVGGLTVLALGGCIFTAKKVVDAVNQAQERQKEKEVGGEYHTTDKYVSIDGLKCEVLSVTYAKMPLENGVTGREFIIISLLLSTENPNKKYAHTSWADRSVWVKNDRVTITDEHGNDYQPVTMGFSERPKGVQMHGTVMAGSDLSDVILIEKPVPGAKLLRVSFGETSKSDRFKFIIKREQWEKK